MAMNGNVSGNIMFLFVITVHLMAGVMGEIAFKHEIALDAAGKYRMWWKFDDTDITIKVKVNTTGWIGWGISPNGKMSGADMVIGWVDNTGKTYFTDRHALSNSLPSVDEHQDYELLEMSEADGCTTIIFTRKIELLNEQDIKITTDTMRILYAWNDEDPTGDNNIPMHMHSTRGSKSVFLMDYGDRKRQPLPKQYNTFDVRMSNFTVPDDKTTYWCNTYKLPDMGEKKQHLIEVDVIITPGNERNVHHMLLYKCMDLEHGEIDKQHRCYSRNMPDSCRNNMVVHAWAIGGSSFYYPPNAGLSLNAEGDPKFLLLEVHYDNPEEKSNIVDSSGLRLYYTEMLRHNDSAVLSAGVKPGKGPYQLIPQQQKNFTSYGFCNSKCRDTSDQKPLIFAVLLHAHLHGTKIIARLVNETTGEEVKIIAEDLNYDFNFQEVRYLKEPIEIPHGHRIDVDCIYNTMDMQEPLVSGLGTQEEMCLAYLYVYPKPTTASCYSISSNYHRWSANTLGWKIDNRGSIMHPVIVGGKNFSDERVFRILQDKRLWENNESLATSFEQSGLDYPYHYICTFFNGSLNVGYTQNLPRRLLVTDDTTEEIQPKSAGTKYSLFVFLFVLPAFLLADLAY